VFTSRDGSLHLNGSTAPFCGLKSSHANGKDVGCSFGLEAATCVFDSSRLNV
jgi:hypothetical protein